MGVWIKILLPLLLLVSQVGAAYDSSNPYYDSSNPFRSLYDSSSGLPLNSDPRVDITLAVDRQKVTIGDPIKLTMTLDIESSLRHERPALGKYMPFEILDYKVATDAVTQNKRQKTVIEYQIALYEVGDFQVGPFPQVYWDNGRKQIKLSNILPIEVQSLAEEADDICDIKAPVELPTRGFLWPIAAACLLFAALLTAIYYYYRRQTPAIAIAPDPKDLRPAHIIALEQLAKLQAQNWLSTGETQRFVVELSHVLRAYLARRFDILALDMHTEELIFALAELDIRPKQVFNIRQFAQFTDLVKFAQHHPRNVEISESVEQCRLIIAQTQLVPSVQLETGETDDLS